MKTALELGEQLKQFFWNNRGVLVATPGVAALVILVRLTGFLQPWEWNAFDLYMRWRPPEQREPRIAIVGIDERDLHQHQINESIISDSILANLLKKIKAHQPRAIGLDIYRDLPVNPGHQALVTVFNTTPNLVGIQKVAGEKGIETVAPPPILKKKGQVGANDLMFDGDNRVRRGFIYLKDGGETIYSFSLHLALHYLEKEGISFEVIDGKREQWKLGKAIFNPLETNDGGYVRTDAGGYQLLINYRGGNQHFERVSMTQIMENQVPPGWGRDRIILVGKVGSSFKDLSFTPYSTNLFELRKPVTGVEIHANLTSQIITAALEGRPLIRTWSEPLEWLWIIFWSGVGANLSWQLRYLAGIRIFSWRKWFSFIGVGSLLFGITYGAFLMGWWLPAVPGFLALSGSAIAVTAYVAGTANTIRKTFIRYLSAQIVAKILESPSGLKLGGERRRITLLTSDLRGFTSIAEQLSPEKVIKMLNFYFKYMADVIAKYEGTIDEFMGDGILVLFGAPTSQPDDAQRAIACALEMQMAMQPVNEQITQWGLPKLEMGIGINTGEVVVGNIGSEKRTKYGVVGAQVNLTYRIESYTTAGQIFISQATLAEGGAEAIIDTAKQVQPKGIPHPITIYSVRGMAGKYTFSLPQEEEVFYLLETPIALQYTILEGKDVGQTLFQGSLVQLSTKGALIVPMESDNLLYNPPPMSNIKLNFFLSDKISYTSDDVYAKVRDTLNENHSFYILFTAKPLDISQRLDTLYESLKFQHQKIEL